MHPDRNREGFGVFVRCFDLTANTPIAKFVSAIEALDDLLFRQIDGNKNDFFPNPYGGAIYLAGIEETLDAVRALAAGLSAAGISAGIGVASGRFQRIFNVQDWNAAALPLNQAARLGFWEEAAGRILVTPHFRELAGDRIECRSEGVCEVKGVNHPYHAIESAERGALAAAVPNPATAGTAVKNIVLWDIVKYSAKDPDELAELSHSLALIADTALHKFNRNPQDYSPTGDGGFALFETGLQAMAFAKELGKASKKIVIRTGINHGEVAFARRGPVGPGVLRADEISASAPSNGIAVLAEVWQNFDRNSREDWQPREVAPGILALDGAKPPVKTGPLTAEDREILVAALAESPDFQTVRQRQTFILTSLEKHPSGKAVYNTLLHLDWEGGPKLVAHDLVRRVELQFAAPDIPALRPIAEALPQGDELADLRRRFGWDVR
jgi:hypothetical protein